MTRSASLPITPLALRATEAEPSGALVPLGPWLPAPSAQGDVCAAAVGRVVRTDGTGQLVLESRTTGRVPAHSALDGRPLQVGDRVLSVVDASGDRYVIGVLSRPSNVACRTGSESPRGLPRAPASAPPDAVMTSDGTRASIERDERGREVLRVADGHGELLLEHRPGHGTRIVSRAGSDVELSTQGSLRLHGERGVQISSPAGLDVDVGALRAQAGRTELDTGDVELRASSASATIERLRAGIDVMELRAKRIVERAGEVFREVSGLAQVRAGRIRLLADHALDLLGRHAEIRASEDVKVKADRIYLG